MSQNSEKQLRKRGANYTQEEKSLLTDLIMQYKHTIENKKTGGIFIKRKREAWNAITNEYNSSTSGIRDTEQLKALYDNMKQKSRKDVGESNKLAYINTERNEKFVTQDELSQALKNVKDDKLEMQKTGGGFWKPKSTDNDIKILAVIQDQVDPLPNPYDSASVFFKDTDLTIESQLDTNYVEDSHATTSRVVTQEIDKNTFKSSAQKQQHSEKMEVHTPIKTLTPARKKVFKKNEVSTERRILKITSADALKKLYFKKKCQNADLEKKKLLLEIMHLKKEHNMKIQLFKNKLNMSKQINKICQM